MSVSNRAVLGLLLIVVGLSIWAGCGGAEKGQNGAETASGAPSRSSRSAGAASVDECRDPATRASRTRPLNVLLTNDDGFAAPGLRAMRAALQAAGHRVTVVAPLRDVSGSSASANFNFGSTVALVQQEPGVWSVDGTAADALRVGLLVVLADAPPDLVVSGINQGQNISTTANHSGTVGAAVTALEMGVPALAVSVGVNIAEAGTTPRFASTLAAYAPASQFVAALVAHLQCAASVLGQERLLPPGVGLNINYPPLPQDQIRGSRLTRIGRTSWIEFTYVRNDQGQLTLSVRIPESPRDPMPDADINAYYDGFISITPIDGDWTASSQVMDDLGQRLSGIVR